MNPLIGMMARQTVGNMPQMQMIQRFNDFRNAWTPDGAQRKINEMLNTGQITQDQFEQAREMASRMSSLFR